MKIWMTEEGGRLLMHFEPIPDDPLLPEQRLRWIEERLAEDLAHIQSHAVTEIAPITQEQWGKWAGRADSGEQLQQKLGRANARLLRIRETIQTPARRDLQEVIDHIQLLLDCD